MPYNYGFELAPKDERYLETLRLVNRAQYDVLMATHIPDRLSNQKVAVQLGIPLNTVKTRLHRARLKISKWRMADGIKSDGML